MVQVTLIFKFPIANLTLLIYYIFVVSETKQNKNI